MSNLESRLKKDYTFSKPESVRGEPDARTVHLKVGVQSFCVADAEDEEHAEFYRDMLARALANIVLAQR